jgi:hypothetical protein
VDPVAVVLVQPEVERGEVRDRPRHADDGMHIAPQLVRYPLFEERPGRGRALLQLAGGGRIRVEVTLGQAHGADVETVVPADAVGAAEDELGGAAADVEDDRAGVERAVGGDAAERQQGLVVAGQELRREAVAPLDLAEERFAVLRVADGTRRDRERALGALALEDSAVVGEHVANARDGDGEEAAPLVDALTQACHARVALELADPSVLDVCDEEPGRVGAEIDRADAGHATEASGAA